MVENRLEKNKENNKYEKTKGLTIHLKSPLKQTNFLTEARQYLSPQVYRAIKFIVNKVMVMGLDLQKYIEREETLKLVIPISEIKKEYPTNQYDRDITSAVKWLNETNVHYNTPTGYVFTHLIGEAAFNKKIGMTVYINPGALQLYHVQTTEFTLLDFRASMVIKNKPAQFFYDKCCMWRARRKFEYTPDELREKLNSSYDNSRLKERIILDAEQELKSMYNQGTIDVYFDLEEIREGRGRGGTLKKWIFRVRSTATSDDTQNIIDSLNYRKEIVGSLQNFLPASLQNISSQLENFSCDRLIDLKERIQYFIETEIPSGKIRDHYSYVFIFLRDEFGINPNVSAKNMKKSGKKAQEMAEPELKPDLFLPVQWISMLEKLKTLVPPEKFKIWFTPAAFNFNGFDGRTLVVVVPSEFVRDMIEKTYVEQLRQAIYASFGEATQLMYTVLTTTKK